MKTKIKSLNKAEIVMEYLNRKTENNNIEMLSKYRSILEGQDTCTLRALTEWNK